VRLARPPASCWGAGFLDERVELLGVEQPAQIQKLPRTPQVPFVHGLLVSVQAEDEQPFGAVVKYPGGLGMLCRELHPFRKRRNSAKEIDLVFVMDHPSHLFEYAIAESRKTPHGGCREHIANRDLHRNAPSCGEEVRSVPFHRERERGQSEFLCGNLDCPLTWSAIYRNDRG
jgi:hypothetical protein